MPDLIGMGEIALVAGAAAATGAGLIWAAARMRLARQAHELRIRDWSLSNLRSELEEREELLDAFLTHSFDVAIHLDAEGAAIAVSPSCQPLLGYSPADMVGHACFDVIHPDDVALAQDWVASGGAREGRVRVRRRDGHLLTMDARCRPLPDRRGALFVLSDVTKRVEMEAQLAGTQARVMVMGERDGLTGLANRGCFMTTLDAVLREPGSVAVLLLDLDRFGTINEAQGHAFGDLVLRTAAERLTRELPEAAMIARLGDDEFAVLLRLTDGEMTVAAHARDSLRAVEAAAPGLSATMGLAVSPRDGADAAALLRRAEIALHQAKLAGGGAYRFYEARMEAGRAPDEPSHHAPALMLATG